MLILYANAGVHCRCLFGGAQYKPGTGSWATKVKCMMQPPDFGKLLSKDRFARVKRYLARGPLGLKMT